MSLNAIPAPRLACLLGGLAALGIAVASPLATLDCRLLIAHMLQHLILMTVAAPLILIGVPAITLPRGLLESLMPRLTNPVIAWFAGTATVIAWHIPRIFELGMSSDLWHAIEHACFFAAGLLFWWPILRPSPAIARSQSWMPPVYLFLATLPCDALSAFLTFCGRVVYPSYLSMQQPLHLSALEDQEWAGTIMWVWVTFAYLVPAITITMRLLSPQASERAACHAGVSHQAPPPSIL